ncbi:MAG: DUF5110 domain-containing protein [Fimbriimonadaceae bacterium]|nr:DUF5110 domain-containing protein [Fimbriimonadaceae bacterium]
MKAAFCISLAVLAAAGSAQSRDEVFGNIRIQALSDTVIRIEQKGRGGWEDRSTFHIQRKKWRGSAYFADREDDDDFEMFTENWELKLDKRSPNLNDIEIRDRKTKTLLWKWDGSLPNSVWLPSPGDKPKVWWFADAPRIVPPKWGLTPSPNPNDPTSGWDIGNNAPDIYIFLPSGNYRQLRKDFLELTGRNEMPPLYLLGYIHSRYHPYSEQSALGLIDEYRKRKFPLDVFVIDTDWRIGASHGYDSNVKLFPDMARFLAAAHKKNVRTMFNDHPEPQAPTALDPKELAYRSEGLTRWLKAGLDVWWYDRNWAVGLREPLPNLRKEVWGMMLYRDITQAAKPNLRPAMMANVDGIDNGYRNRPPNIAAHRFPIQWTGDQGPSFDFLRKGVENAVHAGVHTTFAYMSEDLGGHTGHPSPELFVRFMQYGALSPVMRLHYTARLPDREPWAWGSEIEQMCRDYTLLRYRLLPLFYASARENYETGEPILRRCDLDYPQHAEAKRDDQYLLGKGILVAPVVDGMAQKPVPLEWFRTSDGGSGIFGEFFDNPRLEGTPRVSDVERAIDFVWGTRARASTLPADNFSARFTTKVGPIPGDKPIKLGLIADDGVRMWIDGKLVIDKWVPQDSVLTFSPQHLQPGKTYDIKIEYMELSGNATCRLVYADAIQNPVSKRDVWIPPGQWQNVWTGQVIKGPTKTAASATLAQMPIFVKSGTIIPLAPQMDYVGQKPWSAVTLDIYPGASATQLIYEDDTTTNAYKNGGMRKTPIAVSTKGKDVVVNIGKTTGDYNGASKLRAWEVRLNLVPGWTPGKQVSSVTIDGKAVKGWKVTKQDPKSRMPFALAGSSRSADVLVLSIPSADVAKAHTVTVRFK